MFASRALRLRAGLASGAGCCAFRRAPARCAENEQPPPEPEPWFERIAEALDDAVDIATTAVGYHGGDYAKEDIEEGPGRYAAYARRFAQVFLVKGRLIAYTSDVGESFRPVVPRSIVRLAYGVTWAYVGVDVAYNTAEEHLRGSSPITVLRTAVHAATFQSIASVLVPSVVIHQVVHTVDHAAKRLPPGFLARWLPSMIGMACIPLMPYIDHPVENVIDVGFNKLWPKEQDTDKDKTQVNAAKKTH